MDEEIMLNEYDDEDEFQPEEMVSDFEVADVTE